MAYLRNDGLNALQLQRMSQQQMAQQQMQAQQSQGIGAFGGANPFGGLLGLQQGQQYDAYANTSTVTVGTTDNTTATNIGSSGALRLDNSALHWVMGNDCQLTTDPKPKPKPIRFIDKLRHEIKTWHGDILRAA